MTRVLLNRLSFAYGSGANQVLALNDVSLQVESGELLAVLGPSGCGKTTLLRLIAGLQHPKTGDIRFNDTSVIRHPPKQRGVMMVFQDEQLFPYMTVFHNVAFGLKSQRIFGARLRNRVEEVLELVQMSGYERRFPHELSGGQQQRVALARAIAIQPSVLLLDEPLSHLDSTLRDNLRDVIRNIQQELGVTTLFVTHDQIEARSIADRIALLFGGQLLQLAKPKTLFSQPKNEEIARFLGIVNIFDGYKQHNCIRTDLGELHFQHNQPIVDGTIRLIIPASAIAICTDSTDLQQAHNRFQARIAGYKYRGDVIRYTLQIQHTTLYMDVLTPLGYSIDETVCIHIHPEAIQVLP